jgi:hypothetical protein
VTDGGTRVLPVPSWGSGCPGRERPWVGSPGSQDSLGSVSCWADRTESVLSTGRVRMAPGRPAEALGDHEALEVLPKPGRATVSLVPGGSPKPGP